MSRVTHEKIFTRIDGWSMHEGLVCFGPLLMEYNFLFVRLDSCSFEHFRKQTLDLFGSAGPDSSTEQNYSWTDEGIWICGADILGLLRSSHFPPIFNAAYIFQNSIKRCRPPSYHFSSETDQFDQMSDPPENLLASIAETGACGYLADGSGLNVLFLTQPLIEQWDSIDFSTIVAN